MAAAIEEAVGRQLASIDAEAEAEYQRRTNWKKPRKAEKACQTPSPTGEFTGTPVQDQHSPAADPTRGLPNTPEPAKPVVDQYSYEFPSALSWMSR